MRGRAIHADPHRDLLLAAVAASRAPTLLVGAAGADFPILDVNSAFAELAGYAVDLLRGRDLSAFELLECDAATLARLREACDAGSAVELDLRLARPDGRRLRVALSAAPLRDRAGRVHYLLCSIAASPAPADAAEAARPSPGELALEARRVGHEFNNMLTVIRGSLDPLRAAPSDALTARRLERIAAVVDGVTDLVRGLIGAVRRAGDPGAGAPEQRALPRARGAETILLVEPDPIFRAQAAAMLRGLGYRIEAAADAEAALRWLSGAERVDLMLVDQQVECPDSIPVAARVRETRPELPILFSADAPTPQGRGLIAKPFQLLALARAVRAAIDGADGIG